CIAGESGKMVDFIFADVYGGMQNYADAGSHTKKRHAFQEENATAKLMTVSLNDFLIQNMAPKNIDYLSIDTEGSEYEILASFPFSEWDIEFITVEHNYTPMRDKIFDLMTSNGYRRIKSKFDDWYCNT